LLTVSPDSDTTGGGGPDFGLVQYVGDGTSTGAFPGILWIVDDNNALDRRLVSYDLIVVVTNSSENQKHPVQIDIGCGIEFLGGVGKDTCSATTGYGLGGTAPPQDSNLASSSLRVDVFTP
jgi:hypothetical protein